MKKYLLLLFFLAGCLNNSQNKILYCDLSFSSDVVVEDILVADDAVTQRCGLSKECATKDLKSILFKWSKSDQRVVWMKGVNDSLSAGFFDSAGRLFRIVDMNAMAPDSTDNYYFSLDPAQYILEVPLGWFNENAVEVGDLMTIESCRYSRKRLM
jgi:uncharacterized membrane protein (UPF0127 family)